MLRINYQLIGLCHASSVNVFKNRIGKYLVKVGYTWYKGRLHLE